MPDAFTWIALARSFARRLGFRWSCNAKAASAAIAQASRAGRGPGTAIIIQQNTHPLLPLLFKFGGEAFTCTVSSSSSWKEAINTVVRKGARNSVCKAPQPLRNAVTGRSRLGTAQAPIGRKVGLAGGPAPPAKNIRARWPLLQGCVVPCPGQLSVHAAGCRCPAAFPQSNLDWRT